MGFDTDHPSLAASVTKVDVYLSLAQDRAPQIRRDELDLRIPVPYTLWNGYGLHPYFERKAREPADRKSYKISQLMRCSTATFSPTWLYEDMQLMLFDIAQTAWQFSQVRSMDSQVCFTADSRLAQSAIARLDKHAAELHSLGNIIDDPASSPAVHRYLMWAYSGKEPAESSNSENSITERIWTARNSTMMLYHLINIHIYANVRLLRDLVVDAQISSQEAAKQDPADASRRLTNDAIMNTWVQSSDGRSALLHSVAIVKAYEAGYAPFAPQAPGSHCVHRLDYCSARFPSKLVGEMVH